MVVRSSLGAALVLAVVACGGASSEDTGHTASGGSSAADGGGGTSGSAGGVGGDAGVAGASGAGTGGSVAGAAGAGTGGAGGAGATGGVGGSSGASGDRYWTIEERAVELGFDDCDGLIEGRTEWARVTILINSSCEHPGPAVAEAVSGPNEILVRGWLWVEHGVDCMQIDSVSTRTVPLQNLTNGTWTVRAAQGSSSVTLNVSGSPPPNTCTDPQPETGPCVVDCDCLDGLPCGRADGPSACTHACGRSCDENLDCGPSKECATGSMYAGVGQCVERPWDSCSGGCPAGMECMVPFEQPPSCEWSLQLGQAMRHACQTDTDCNAGTRCIEAAAGSRFCDVPCTTSTMRCPSAHWCVAQGDFTQNHWICEWVGD